MAANGRREEAEKLYARQSMACPHIAKTLDVSEGTVCRRKAEAAEKGEAFDWDAQRRVFNMPPREMFAIYAETVKAWIVQLQKNPDLLADGKIADATAKHASVLQKLDTRSRYLWGGGNAGGVCARRLAIFLEKHVKFLVGSGGPVFSAAHHSLHA